MSALRVLRAMHIPLQIITNGATLLCPVRYGYSYQLRNMLLLRAGLAVAGAVALAPSA